MLAENEVGCRDPKPASCDKTGPAAYPMTRHIRNSDSELPSRKRLAVRLIATMRSKKIYWQHRNQAYFRKPVLPPSLALIRSRVAAYIPRTECQVVLVVVSDRVRFDSAEAGSFVPAVIEPHHLS
jgi:hypothetical protein